MSDRRRERTPPNPPSGAAQGENWLGGPERDELRERASRRARSVVEDGGKEGQEDQVHSPDLPESDEGRKQRG